MIDAANGNAVSYFHFDHLGSTLALTCATGATTDAYSYTPYGELTARTGSNPQPFTYIGKWGVRSEPAANLYDMRARYYAPATSRFLSRDPKWPRIDEPLSANPYEYAARCPLDSIDPQGTDNIESQLLWIDDLFKDPKQAHELLTDKPWQAHLRNLRNERINVSEHIEFIKALAERGGDESSEITSIREQGEALEKLGRNWESLDQYVKIAQSADKSWAIEKDSDGLVPESYIHSRIADEKQKAIDGTRMIMGVHVSMPPTAPAIIPDLGVKIMWRSSVCRQINQ